MEFLIADDIYKLQCLKFFYKYENGNIAAYFQNMFLTQFLELFFKCVDGGVYLQGECVIIRSAAPGCPLHAVVD